MNHAYIYDALRTPRARGSQSGALYEVRPVDLLGAALSALRSRLELDTSRVDDLLVGCVTPIDDQGHNIGRAAMLHTGWSESVGSLQLNRSGASGLEAINLAAMKIRSGWGELVVAGGVESMSRVPAGSDGGALIYDPGVISRTGYLPQGIAADLLATLQGFSREQLEAFVLQSHERAIQAREQGFFQKALVPIHDNNGLVLLAEDEDPAEMPTLESLAALPPAFSALGALGFDELAQRRYPAVGRIQHVHSSATVARPADGAALLLLGNEEQSALLGRRPRARIRAAAGAGVDPSLLLTGPAPAARKALELAGMAAADIDLWECQETFAVVALHFQQSLELDPDCLNVNGGALAFGHPLGASGAMLLGGLLDELERRDLSTGCAVMAASGGMAVATIIERV